MTRAGLCAIIGRPNVGKSTLINNIIGEKVTITSSTPNTTRQLIRGILTEDNVQIVFVDTPGLHRPKTSLGSRLNDNARAATDGVDVIIAMIDAFGPDCLEAVMVAPPAWVSRAIADRESADLAREIAALQARREQLEKRLA